ncbi:MAG: cation transporter [Parcubacteria group bacterium]|nr:cation transporter [Parcubacteria group bacterium]
MAGHYPDCPGPATCWCEVRRLSLVLGLTIAILILEIFGGWYSGSLALWADAGHVFTDSAGIVVTIGALVLMRLWKQNKAREVASRINIGLLFLLAGTVAFETFERLTNPVPVVSPVVIVVIASIGGIGNFFQHKMLKASTENHEALLQHIFSDLVLSMAVVVGGVTMWAFGWFLVDPLLSLVIALWIFYQALKLAFGSEHGHSH